MKGRTSFHNSFNLQKDCNEKKSMSLEICSENHCALEKEERRRKKKKRRKFFQVDAHVRYIYMLKF